MTDLEKMTPEATKDLILQLAHNMPTLSDLTPAQAEAIAKAFLADQLKAEMGKAVMAARIRFEEECLRFIGDQKSGHTQRAYKTALETLATWMTREGLNLATITPALADDFIRDQRTTGKDEDTIRLRIAAISSFFTFLERRFSEIRNPFRGTKIRPRSTWATADVPTSKEIKSILQATDPKSRAAIAIMLEVGLRIGAMPELRIKADGTFWTDTKGKRFEGFEPLSTKTLDLIRAAGLPIARPFDPKDHAARNGEDATTAKTAHALATRIQRITKTLNEAGTIRAAYSAHDFRHAFAEAHKGKGLVWLRDRLGHASIAVTEKYLKNTLGVNVGEM